MSDDEFKDVLKECKDKEIDVDELKKFDISIKDKVRDIDGGDKVNWQRTYDKIMMSDRDYNLDQLNFLYAKLLFKKIDELFEELNLNGNNVKKETIKKYYLSMTSETGGMLGSYFCNDAILMFLEDMLMIRIVLLHENNPYFPALNGFHTWVGLRHFVNANTLWYGSDSEDLSSNNIHFAPLRIVYLRAIYPHFDLFRRNKKKREQLIQELIQIYFRNIFFLSRIRIRNHLTMLLNSILNI